MSNFITDCEFSGQYIGRNDIHKRSYITDFMKDSFYSNQANPNKTVDTLLKYEDLRNHKNKIYAVELRLMIPNNLKKDSEHEIIKNFMLGISLKYKTICYLYRIITIGKGRYANVIAFERNVYYKPKELPKHYKRDMYIDKVTGRTTNPKNPKAVHICKKGEIMKDKNGNCIKEVVQVTNKKRYFHYYNKLNNPEKRNMNFNLLMNRLKAILIQSISKTISNIQTILKLKNKYYSKIFSKSKRIKIMNYNNRINKINIKLSLVQDAFYRKKVFNNHDEAVKEFYALFYSLVKVIDQEELKVTKNKPYKASISLTKHLSFQQLNQNLDFFVSVAENKIQNWHDKYLPIN